MAITINYAGRSFTFKFFSSDGETVFGIGGLSVIRKPKPDSCSVDDITSIWEYAERIGLDELRRRFRKMANNEEADRESTTGMPA